MTKLFNEKYYEHLTTDDLANEIWKPIEDYPNYMISSCGRVKSLERTYYSGKYYQVKKVQPESILKPGFNTSKGYLHVTLVNTHGRKTIDIHRIVGQAFCENKNPDKRTLLNHMDGVKTHNQAANLEWCTPSHNVREAYRLGLNKTTDAKREFWRKLGLRSAGERHGMCKLSDKDCLYIREKYATNDYTLKEIASEFNVCRQTISNIVKFKRKQTNID